MKQKFHALALALIVFGVVTRLLPHPVNFTAVGALALWSTTLFRSRAASFAIPLTALFISDLFLGFHSTMVWVYGAFLLIAALSLVIEPKTSWLRAAGGSLTASLLFFLITNFGVWTTRELYPLTTQGLLDSYVMAIPFLKNQILGDLFYTGLLGVAARALASKREASLQRA
jgi:hypothetical protein